MKCPSCGADAAGKFCSNCGAKLNAANCPSCGAKLSAGAKFCHACGATVSAGQVARPGVLPWIIAGGAVVALLLVLAITQFRPNAQPAVAGPAGAPPAGALPDLSQMTPREIADRLYDRTMMAAERGIADTVAFFAPKAIGAYASLGPLDPDAHYHLGLLHVVVDEYDAALAQADTLEQGAPNHLYAALIRWEVAQARGDAAAQARARQRFLDHYDAERAAGREEYSYHTQLLQQRLAEFRAETAGSDR